MTRPLLPRRPRAALRVVHVVLATGWTGLTLVMLTLALAALARGVPAHTVFVLNVMDVVGGTAIPILAVGTVVSGVAAGLGTRWGLFRYRWVVAKTVLSLAVIVSAVTLTDSWLEQAALGGGTDPATLWRLAATSVAHLLSLLAATVLSIEKPGGRMPSLTGNHKVA